MLYLKLARRSINMKDRCRCVDCGFIGDNTKGYKELGEIVAETRESAIQGSSHIVYTKCSRNHWIFSTD